MADISISIRIKDWWTRVRENGFFYSLTNIFFPLRWTKIDSYLFSEFIKVALGALFLFVVIYLFSNLINELNYLLADNDPNITPSYILEMYFYRIPYLIVLLSPVAFLFATVYVLGQFYKNNEVVTVIGAGIYLYRFSFSIIVFCFLYSLFLIYFTDNIVAKAWDHAEHMNDVIRHRADNRLILTNIHVAGANNIFYFIKNFNTQDTEMNNVVINKERFEIELGELDKPRFLDNPELERMYNQITLDVRDGDIEFDQEETAVEELDKITLPRPLSQTASRLWLYQNVQDPRLTEREMTPEEQIARVDGEVILPRFPEGDAPESPRSPTPSQQIPQVEPQYDDFIIKQLPLDQAGPVISMEERMARTPNRQTPATQTQNNQVAQTNRTRAPSRTHYNQNLSRIHQQIETMNNGEQLQSPENLPYPTMRERWLSSAREQSQQSSQMLSETTNYAQALARPNIAATRDQVESRDLRYNDEVARSRAIRAHQSRTAANTSNQRTASMNENTQQDQHISQIIQEVRSQIEQDGAYANQSQSDQTTPTYLAGILSRIDSDAYAGYRPSVNQSNNTQSNSYPRELRELQNQTNQSPQPPSIPDQADQELRELIAELRSEEDQDQEIILQSETGDSSQPNTSSETTNNVNISRERLAEIEDVRLQHLIRRYGLDPIQDLQNREYHYAPEETQLEDIAELGYPSSENERQQMVPLFIEEEERETDQDIMNQADSENQNPPSIGAAFEEPMVKIVDMSKFTVDDDIFYEYDVDPFLQWRIDAEKVRWDDELEQWIVYNGVKRTWDFRGRLLSLEYMDNQALPELTERPFHFINTDKKVERMTLEECQLQIYKLMRSHKRYKKQEVEMYSRKIAFQFSTFVVVLVGLTLGRFHSRKSVLIRSFIMALIVFFLYFILYQLGESIGKKTTLPSYLTPHLGNIAYVLMSIVLMKRSQT